VSNVTADNDTLIVQGGGNAMRIQKGVSKVVCDNDTFYQSGASNALQLQNASSNITLDNNILWTNGGYDIDVSSDSENGFASDYNDLYATGTAKLANWQGMRFSSQAQWYRTLGFDAHSISADPQFNDPANDDLTLKSTSPAIDAGDPSSYYFQEPLPDGGRINLGAQGGTPQATPSPAQELQFVSPTELDELTAGQATTIQWRSSGLTQSAPVALINMGGPTVDNWLADVFRTSGETQTSTFVTTDTSGVSNPPPSQVFQSGDTAPILAYQLPVPDGTYNISLEFSESDTSASTQRLFDIVLNGTTVATKYDIYAQAGDRYNTAVEATFSVTASRGSGINLQLITRDTIGYGAILNGLRVTAANPLGLLNPKVDLQLSTDGGNTWSTVVAGLTMDVYGRGSFTWIPTAAQVSSNALLRVVSEDYPSIVGTSAPFSIGVGNDYYVAPTGSDLNDGRTPATAIQSLAASLRAFPNIGAGATVHVASGTYSLLSSAVIAPFNSGLTITGPADHSAVFSWASAVSGADAIDVEGSNITIEDLAVTGAADGILSTGTYASIINCLAYGNTAFGTDAPGSNADIAGNTVYSEPIGINADGPSSIVTENTASQCSTSGIGVGGNGTEAFGNTSLDCNTGFVGGGDVSISDNTAYHNSTGVSIDSGALVSRNTVYAQSGDGILVGNAGNATANTVYDNQFGIEVDDGGTASGNLSFDNTAAGVLLEGGKISGQNRVLANPIGVEVAPGEFSDFGGAVTNTLIYNDSADGILVERGDNVSILNNTIYQDTGGDAVHVQNASAGVKLDNNILWSTSGYDIFVTADSQLGFVSDFNDLYTTGTGKVGNWGGYSYPTFADWSGLLSFDADSLSADPLFNNLAAGDFTLEPNSPAVDAGDLASFYLSEPQPNGGRIDLGAYGNTAQRTPSPNQELQIVAPEGTQTLSVGQPTTIQWRSWSLTPFFPIALINMGRTTVDNWLADTFQTAQYYTDSIDHAVDTSGVTDPAPQQVYQTYEGTSGNLLSYQLPVPDGAYHISLEFVEPDAFADPGRMFNIALNGTTVATNYNIEAAAGGPYKAVEVSYDVTASDGSGINLQLIKTAGNGLILSGLRLTAINPSGVANPTVDLQISTDGGSTWSPIASGLTMDAYGRGGYAWTPTARQAGSNVMLRVVSDDFPSVMGVSSPLSVGSGDAGFGSIVGRVFYDANDDGLMGNGEGGLTGVTIYLDTNDNGQFDSGEPSVTTDANGVYTFSNVPAGAYVVRQVVPPGDAYTTPAGGVGSVTVLGGPAAAGPVFGDVAISSVPMNFSYLVKMAENYGRAGTFATGDLNGDGAVNFADLVILAQNYNKTLPPPTATAAVFAASQVNVAAAPVVQQVRARHTVRHNPRRLDLLRSGPDCAAQARRRRENSPKPPPANNASDAGSGTLAVLTISMLDRLAAVATMPLGMSSLMVKLEPVRPVKRA